MEIAPAVLVSVTHCVLPRANLFASILNRVCPEFEINTPPRVAQFIAQAATETAGLTRLAENLNYSEAALLRTFPQHISAFDAAHLARQPEQIANVVYANRMGNGPISSGDGWRYRGRGIFGITGRAEYARCGTALDIDLISRPEYLEWPSWACRSGAWYWQDRGLNELADAWRFEEITRRINGGENGESDRLEYLKRAKVALNIQ